MGVEFADVTQEELCDLMCGKPEREVIDGYKYAVGDVIELKNELNNSLFAEIVFVDVRDCIAPYQIRQEYEECDDMIYSWISEKEIECLVR